jgi:putative addiction module CopG family antidote
MPTRNISLTPEQDAFVEGVVKAGEYQNASEAVRDALRALQQRRREDALKRCGCTSRPEWRPLTEGNSPKSMTSIWRATSNRWRWNRVQTRADPDGAISSIATGKSRPCAYSCHQHRAMGNRGQAPLRRNDRTASIARIKRKIGDG